MSREQNAGFPSDVSLKDSLKKLENYFDSLNQIVFKGKLERPVITISPDQTSGAYGWCSANKIWNHGDEGEGYFEINLCAEYLNRPINDVISTLLHEMVHLFNLTITKVQDTSRNGYYHNTKFKQAAIDHGLDCEKTEKYGWSKTTLQDWVLNAMNNQTDEGFSLHRNIFANPAVGKTSKKSSSRKYVCPMCGAIVRATKEVHIICGDCNCEFELEED